MKGDGVIIGIGLEALGREGLNEKVDCRAYPPGALEPA